ncbi:GH116 family glycosyl hydrolase [Polyangium sp. 6x1]|uniref:GH116 family glycosyl hydrolase n=1 Tax=Polyangium sp. 6x1 TaxID=3042689 RepID=UPI0024828FCF|nr:GH116 family glycosyl hydrolase [Polyangium sp. 6x1]MDI1446776.1 GH116 family glycosyl hydrolase [Polyangium sp. 6x1]
MMERREYLRNAWRIRVEYSAHVAVMMWTLVSRHISGEHIFNGEYYVQKVIWEGLRDTSFAESIAKVDESSGEVQRLLKAEGPKYQYGKGCLSDGVIGAWMARIYGIHSPLNRANVAKSLAAIFRYNFRADLWEHACTQRPGYAWGHEPGLLLCSWPNGDKPTLPFPYSDEVWTGIEYQVASHLIEEGLVDEGLTIVRAARSRYDGRTRNPWNEYECGNYYARAMSSYALIGSLAGFAYAAATRTLRLGPRLAGRPFRTFFSTTTGWGSLALDGDGLSIELAEGELAVEKLLLTLDGKTCELACGITARAGERAVVAV